MRISDQTTGPWEYMARIPLGVMPYALVPRHLQNPFPEAPEVYYDMLIDA